MANPQKNNFVYKEIVEAFDSLASGNTPKNFEALVSKTHLLFLNHYAPSIYPTSDFGRQSLENIRKYCTLLLGRRKVNIAGGEREIAPEQEVYTSLILAEKIANQLIAPLFRKKTDFSNRVFNDLRNLGLAYVDAIVNAVGEEYINPEEVVEAKQRAIDLAKWGINVYDTYGEIGLKGDIKIKLKNLEKVLLQAQSKYLRSFANVPTTQKRIYKGKQLMHKLEEQVTEENCKGFLFKPKIVFPIAHGGTELGIRIANAYEKGGHSPIVYPLLYSIKTKKHRYPWIANDSHFLGKSLEGENILLTEDWVTTGNTLRGIIQQIENTYPHEVRIATIKRDKEKSIIPILDKYNFYVGTWAKYEGGKTDSLAQL